MLRVLPALLVSLTIALPALALMPAPALGSALGPEVVPNEVVVLFDGAIPAGAEAWVAAQGGQVLLRNDAVHFLSVRLADSAAADRFLAQAQQRADVTVAERDGYVYADDFTPNDPLFAQQYAPQQVNLPGAWDLTLGSHAVKIAILDTGIKIDHPDLVGNVCGPFRAYDGSGSIIDVNGHGTHTSGIAAARINNGVGMAGASNSCIMGAKVLNNGGSGQWSWLADGITWAADNGAHVISMSLSGGGGDAAVSAAVKYAFNTKGVLLVGSTGNGGCGSPNQQTGYPAQYDEVVGVGALSNGDVVASYSTCGIDMELTAGGTSVISTWVNGGYASLTGTSMSAPMVSGAAALVKAAIPSLTGRDLRCLLDLTADDVIFSLPGRDYETGWGKVDPKGAIETHGLLVQQGLWDDFQGLCVTAEKAIMH